MWNKFKTLLKDQLTQGVSPQSLALGCAVTIAVSTFPIAGTTWIILAVLAWALKLNQPLTQTLNQLLTPLWIFMLPVYVRIGEWLVDASPISINPRVILEQIQENWREVIIQYGKASLYGALAWTLIAPLASFILYRILLILFSRMNKKGTPQQDPSN